jgi:hypothetical protein
MRKKNNERRKLDGFQQVAIFVAASGSGKGEEFPTVQWLK